MIKDGDRVYDIARSEWGTVEIVTRDGDIFVEYENGTLAWAPEGDLRREEDL